MDVFVKFGAAETAWVAVGGDEEKTCVNEMFFWGTDRARAPVCLRVQNFPATVRFGFDPEADADPARMAAFDEWVRSPAFANFALRKLGKKARSWDGEHELLAQHLVRGVERHFARPADRPVARDWPCWRVAFAVVTAAARFAYEDAPFADSPFPDAKVFSAAKTGLALLREFYRREELAPFCWWRARGAAPVKASERKRAPAGTREFVVSYDSLDARQLAEGECPPRPGTSLLCYDIESLKNYLEPREAGFDAAAAKARERGRREADAADPGNRGILNSWLDHKVVNIHALYYADCHAKGDPDRSVCLILDAWDGGAFPGFQKGKIATIHRPGLLSTPTEVRSFATEADLLRGFYALFAELDPDVITGWNLLGYDLWMTERRALALGLPKSTFRIGRMLHRACECTDMSFQTAGKGSFGGKKQMSIPGRVVLDGMFALQKDFAARLPLASFSLNSAAEYYLAGRLGNEYATKDDLPYSRMRGAFETPRGRHELASYCLKDTKLTADVVRAMGVVSLYENIAYFVKTELTAVVFRGETERTLPVLTRFYESAPVVFVMEERSTRALPAAQNVTGGLVHSPRAGMFDSSSPVAVFDFASMYPNVIIAFKLDPTTVARRARLLRLGFVEGRDFVAVPASALEGDELVRAPVTDDTLCVLVNFREGAPAGPPGAEEGADDPVRGAGARKRRAGEAGGRPGAKSKDNV